MIYPAKVDDLSTSDINLLAQILSQDLTQHGTNTREIGRMISALPSHLHCSALKKLFGDGQSMAILCQTHRNLNRLVIRHAFHLLQREVVKRLEMLRGHPQVMGPEEAVILNRIQRVQGMWNAPDGKSALQRGVWAYQIDRCEACVLSRVGASPPTLRDLRTIILSHDRNSSPRFLQIIEALIGQHHHRKADILSQSSFQAQGFKDVRRDAVRAEVKQKRQPTIQDQRIRWTPTNPQPVQQRKPVPAPVRPEAPRYNQTQARSPHPVKLGKVEGAVASYPHTDRTKPPRVGLTLEQQLGELNLSPWPGNVFDAVDPAATYKAVPSTKVSDIRHNTPKHHLSMKANICKIESPPMNSVLRVPLDGAGDWDDGTAYLPRKSYKNNNHVAAHTPAPTSFPTRRDQVGRQMKPHTANSHDRLTGEYRRLVSSPQDKKNGKAAVKKYDARSEYTNCSPSTSIAETTWSALYDSAGPPRSWKRAPTPAPAPARPSASASKGRSQLHMNGAPGYYFYS